MRYKLLLSRVQVAERYVRAANEDEAIKRVQEELDRPYGFFGTWKTTSQEIDVAEATPAIETTPRPIGTDGHVLLSLKEAAAHLGISYGSLYELVSTAEIPHVAIGRRRYISRDALRGFIEAHTRLGRFEQG